MLVLSKKKKGWAFLDEDNVVDLIPFSSWLARIREYESTFYDLAR